MAQRPNRSDVHLPREEEMKIEEETREYFNDLAPRRHTKPQRSDYASNYNDAFDYSHSGDIPEHKKFQDLQHTDNHKLSYSANEVPEEYVETEHYKDLNCIDKQHHTTGTGFIKIEQMGSSCLNLGPELDASHSSCRGNPATNEWIPSMEPICITYTHVFHESHKPNRSGN